MTGVPALVEALRSGKIQCQVYRKDKFHAKCYLTHGRQAVIGSFGLVGSSNFTGPGLQDNVELNVQIRGNDVKLLQEWYERHWDESEDITAEVLRTFERHTNPRTPFEVWFKALHELLRDLERTIRDADVILIDEAHHFRNPGGAGEGEKEESRYRKFQQYLHQPGGREKQMFLLTATPINNGVHDFRHILELRTNGDDAYFATGTRNLGIHNLRAHFVQLEKSLLQTPAAAAENEASELFRLEDALQKDIIFEELVVQRSRVYVKKSESGCAGGAVVFPTREVPRVAPYKLKVTYGRLLESVEQAFSRTKPLFALTVEKRAARGSWEAFNRIMSRVPDAPPVPGDERMETAILREKPPKPSMKSSTSASASFASTDCRHRDHSLRFTAPRLSRA